MREKHHWSSGEPICCNGLKVAGIESSEDSSLLVPAERDKWVNESRCGVRCCHGAAVLCQCKTQKTIELLFVSHTF